MCTLCPSISALSPPHLRLYASVSPCHCLLAFAPLPPCPRAFVPSHPYLRLRVSTFGAFTFVCLPPRLYPRTFIFAYPPPRLFLCTFTSVPPASTHPSLHLRFRFRACVPMCLGVSTCPRFCLSASVPPRLRLFASVRLNGRWNLCSNHVYH